ncbi:hypothetical protein DH2020_003648 [Rehmannia glutinosa]|uniref:RNase H type-1 domain-containing protein n=1 Tax=Rehmannia glutinosa TaxID=99300 RepID=A0ABR0XM71_REHGL
MLAKQFWRLLTNPDSLATRLLKAKYYPKDELMNAKIGHQPSFLWRSILAARRVVEDGMAWRVGNGAIIRIRNDRWIAFLEMLEGGTKIPRISKQNKATERWTPPPEGSFKLNSDGAIYANGTVGFGFVIRYAQGEVELAGAKIMTMDRDNTLVEGLAILFALEAARETGIHGLYIKSDCKVMIDGLQGKDIQDSHGELLKEDILNFAQAINCREFSYIPREANKVAHFLAHFVKTPDLNYCG